ncbi:MAG: peptidyl-prolyl cis-trans isomerase [Candidatus Sumerlaeota bacterium]|nr:peptidyl-prolyl cis-trans isomerase [Candidatus Sumerlaeota bacterium]
MTTTNRLLLLAMALLLAGACARTSPTASTAGTPAPLPDITPHSHSPALMAVYLAGLDRLSPERVLAYSTVSDNDRATIAHDALRVSQAVRQCGWADLPVFPEFHQWLDIHLVSRLWENDAREALTPTAEQLAEAYTRQHADRRFPDRVAGQRILARTREEADELAARLRAGEDFTAVAKEYYASLGEVNDGMFANLPRDRANDAIFAAFWSAEPHGPIFGPMETKHGWLIGRTLAKHPAGPIPFDEVRDTLERRWRIERFPTWREDFFTALEQQYGVRRLLPEAPSGDPATPAYEMDGETRTLADVNRLTPGVFGDPANPKFYHSLTERAIRADLLLASEEAARIRATPTYRTLHAALLDQARFQAVADKAFTTIAPNDADLRAFHRTHAERYLTPPEVRLLAVTIARNPESLVEPAALNAASREAWQTITKLREAFLAAGAPEDFDFSEAESTGAVRVHKPTQWQSIEDFGRLVEMNLVDAKEGETSELLIDETSYMFFHVYGWRAGEAAPFEEIATRVHDDFMAAERARLVEQLLTGCDSGS